MKSSFFFDEIGKIRFKKNELRIKINVGVVCSLYRLENSQVLCEFLKENIRLLNLFKI